LCSFFDSTAKKGSKKKVIKIQFFLIVDRVIEISESMIRQENPTKKTMGVGSVVRVVDKV